MKLGQFLKVDSFIFIVSNRVKLEQGKWNCSIAGKHVKPVTAMNVITVVLSISISYSVCACFCLFLYCTLPRLSYNSL